MTMKHILTLLAFLSVFSLSDAWAQRVNPMGGAASGSVTNQDRIAAVVNENVITTSDIEARMKLAFLSSGLPDTPDVREHILPQILRGLIDEQLQTQEAKRLDVSVSKEEIDKALEAIGRDNHIPGDMRMFLQEKGASPQALEDQIRAGLAWNKVIQRELRSRVDVGDDEIETAIARIRANAGKQEFLVNEIFLAVDNAKDEDQVHQAAENLVQQIKHGANFAAVARQFSQSTGAASGGDIGWIQEGQLPSELNNALITMAPQTVAGPIRSANGYHILALREKRTVSLDGSGNGEPTFDLQQAFRPLNAGENRETVANEAQQFRNLSGDCAGLETHAKNQFPSWHLQATNGMKLSQAPSMLADKIRDVPVGKSSEVMNTDRGMLVIFVCGRHVPDGKVDRDAIASGIGSEKLELQARRLQRDLRRSAFIDVRLGKS